MRNLVTRVADSYVKALRFEPRRDDEDSKDLATSSANEQRLDLVCDVGEAEPFDFGQLSGGEQGRVLLAIAMTLA